MKIVVRVLSGIVILVVVVVAVNFILGELQENKVSAQWKAIKSEIKTTATDVSECRAIPAGYKACGGPVIYLIYSASATNEPKLLKLVEQHYKADKRRTQLKGRGSNCDMEQEPNLAIEDGECIGVNTYPHYRTNEDGEIEEYYERYR